MVSKWALTSLGLPLTGRIEANIFWDFVTNKISKILDDWRKSILFISRILTITWSYLSHIHKLLNVIQLDSNLDEVKRITITKKGAMIQVFFQEMYQPRKRM